MYSISHTSTLSDVESLYPTWLEKVEGELKKMLKYV